MKINKKIQKEINQIYTYNKLLKEMPPRGDGAKMAVAKEIHEIFSKRVDAYCDMSDINKFQYTMMLMELTETMLLEMIDESFSVEEMELYD